MTSLCGSFVLNKTVLHEFPTFQPVSVCLSPQGGPSLQAGELCGCWFVFTEDMEPCAGEGAEGKGRCLLAGARVPGSLVNLEL